MAIKQFSDETTKIINAHAKDFNSSNYSSKIKSAGGFSQYVKGLGGVFSAWIGRKDPVKTVSEFQECAEYVFGLMSIWGYDYNNGSTYWHWGSESTGKPSADAFYQSGKGAVNSGTIEELCQGTSGKGRTTNCNYGVDTLMRRAGIFKKPGPWWSCSYEAMVKGGYGTVVRDKSKLQVGDMIHMFKKAITSNDPAKWSSSDWRHVAVILEITDDAIILGDFGSRYIRYKKPRHTMTKTGSGIGPDYDGSYKGWAAVHCVDLVDDTKKEEAIPTMYGIDIASYQSGIDLTKVPGDFVIIKATQDTNYVNPACNAQYASAKKAGKLIGLYHYAGGSGAVAEADFFLKNISNYIGSAILVLDWEAGQNKAYNKSMVSYCKKWLDRVYEKTGVRPLIYMSQSVTNTYDWSAVAKNYGLWVARYRSNNPTGYRETKDYGFTGAWQYPAIFQFTSKGQLSGWSGYLDLNIAYMDRTAWKKYADPSGKNTDKKEETSTVKVTGVYPVCKKGSKGLAVEWIQAAVNAKVDGNFGAKTDASVKAYQKKKKLTQDGIVGAKTWAAIVGDLT